MDAQIQIPEMWPKGLTYSDSCKGSLSVCYSAAVSLRPVVGCLQAPSKVEGQFSSAVEKNSDMDLIREIKRAAPYSDYARKEIPKASKILNLSPSSAVLCEADDESIIPGLPDDISKSCIALVPRASFPDMSRVSKKWRRTLQSQEFRRIRKSSGKMEEWLYALTQKSGSQKPNWQVLSPDGCAWEDLPPLPGISKTGYGFVVVHGILLVIGGLAEEGPYLDALSEVWKYDSATNRWSKVASVQTPRYEFACAVLNGVVYVVGGHGEGKRNLSTVEQYDPQRDQWVYVPSLKKARWGSFAFSQQGKLFVMGGRSSFTIGNSRSVDIFDPLTQKWEEVKNGCVMILSHAVLDQKLFCIEWKNDRKLLVYDAMEKAWKRIMLPLTGSLCVGFCIGILGGKLLLFPTKAEPFCETLVYDPSAVAGGDDEWHTCSIRPQGAFVFCATIWA